MRCPECSRDVVPWTLGTFGGVHDPVAAWLRCPSCRYAWPILWRDASDDTRRDALLAERSRIAAEGMTG